MKEARDSGNIGPRESRKMTALEISFSYGMLPGETEMRALDDVREVYGIRRIGIDETKRQMKVEFDATRLNADTVASLLRLAGIDVLDRVEVTSTV